MAETRYGTFDELLEISSGAMRPIAIALRDLILDVHPDAVEVVRLGDRAATFGVGPKKMSEAHTYVLPYENWVNLGFFWASNLEDPNGRLEGSGTNMRHAKVRALAEVEDPYLRSLVEAAYVERFTAVSG